MTFPLTILKRRISRMIIEQKIYDKNLEINELTKEQGPASCQYQKEISQITNEKNLLITKYNNLW